MKTLTKNKKPNNLTLTKNKHLIEYMKLLPKLEKKSLVGLLLSLLIIFVLGFSIGITLYFINGNYLFISLFSINYFFMVLIYLLMNYFYNNFSNKPNVNSIISLFSRFLVILSALGLTILLLFLTKNLSKPNIFYIFISPLLLTIGYILSFLFK